MIYYHLLDQGFTDSANHIQKESGINMTKFNLADNIVLNDIFQVY